MTDDPVTPTERNEDRIFAVIHSKNETSQIRGFGRIGCVRGEYYRNGSKWKETRFEAGKPVLKSTWNKDGDLVEIETF